MKWGVVVLAALAVAFTPVPVGITPQSWRLLAIFIATIIGSILRPVPGGAVVLLGVSAIVVTGAMPVDQALRGYADPIVWLVLAAFLMSRGMIKTGLGRRIALIFVRAIGHHSLGLGYALISTDAVLATIIPSNGARSGGIVFPIAKSIAETYQSEPGPTARRLGAFLMVLLYQCDVVVCAMFLTGQASNAIIAKLAQQVTSIELTYPRWALGAIVPGVVSLLVVPLLLYRLFPPEIKHTPDASEFAATELKRMGRMSWQERVMLAVFGMVAVLWMAPALRSFDYAVFQVLGNLHYAVVALLGICVLLLSGVLEWEDVISERGAWDVFIWYGGLVRMAEALGETGITKRFAEFAASFTAGWTWWAALAGLLLIYFYAHYAFASITAHVTAMYIPFLILGCWFFLAGSILLLTREERYIWCAWDDLARQVAQQVEPTPNEGIKIYAFEDLIAYHLWFALEGAGSERFKVAVIKGIPGLSEDPAYFLPRSFDDIAVGDINALDGDRIWIAFRDTDWNEDRPPLKTLHDRGYQVKNVLETTAQGQRAFLVYLLRR